MNKETEIQNKIMAALSAAGCLVWRQHVGKFRALNQPAQVISIGVTGMADIMTVQPVTVTADMVGRVLGVAVAYEVKTAKGKQREAQKLWQYALEKRGGIYHVCRSDDQALKQFDKTACNAIA